ncbi:transcription-repair coupling factor [Candidatus Spongiihabitans sp.]|uniref:transcription-repair coupling factor n=1 Tax=Candidatus Spongiihabitans sp. TaxID=3101308 RepID=UPI003C7018BF
MHSLLNPILPDHGQRISWSNLHGAATGMAITEAARRYNGILVIVLEDQRQLQILETEIRYFLHQADNIPVLNFPSWESLPYDIFSPHQDIISDRLRILGKLPTLRRGIVLIQTANLMQRLPPVDYVLGHTFALKKSQHINLDTLKRQLIDSNYIAVNQVMSPGEFAVRGGLVDVFPMGAGAPFRLDLFDDELETIRIFDSDTQRSKQQVDKIELLPAREFPMTEPGIKHFRSSFRRYFEGDPMKQTIYNQVSMGNTPAGTEFFFPLFFDHTATLFDYLQENSVFVKTRDFNESASTYWAEINDRYINANYDPARKVIPPNQLYMDTSEVEERISKYSGIDIIRGHDRKTSWSAEANPNKQFPVDSRKDTPYQELLAHLRASDNKILIVAETPGRKEALEDALLSNNLRPTSFQGLHDFIADEQAALGLAIAPLERGFASNANGIEIICESQLYGEKVYQRRRRSQASRDPESIIKSLTELSIGDPVVHIEHGVGRYQGLHVLVVGGDSGEFLSLEYQNGDKLYIPVLSLNLISRFVGGSPDLAPLHRLGGDQWEKSKKRAREKAYDVAAELLEMEAFRNARKSHAFEINTLENERFNSQFPFEETPDQQQAISEVVSDLGYPDPMDRLVCGDVGFGKTEVALRAAFIVSSNAKQVAILVPTTLLADQHYQTFVERFSDWPINVAALSRFNTREQSAELIKRIANGHIDIVIGTHRLLQDDIRFNALGLLIIDEEHRFGVRQKEKIKRIRSQVDILTLTATPIPRTLNITMAGLRSISIIATPPVNRLSIKTFVRQWNRGLIREACLREIRRGGQVFFLHNEVKSIERMAVDIAELVAEAEVNICHGQMRESQLERVMQDFYHQRFNILVCSTIIESGIDIPTANTIIINRADRFGLAQLHQLRGRVGRSHHQAFAYLLIPDKEYITNAARKRLDAIDSMEDLGAGFALASHDLEIRGAGELLGETQSGSIDEIGFSLYSEYLTLAVNAIKEGKLPEPDSALQIEKASIIDLHVAALFPSDYLANTHTRLILYKRISNATDLEQLEELQIETIDRFGLLPDQGKNLFRLTALRLQAERLDIRKADIGDNGGVIEFHDYPVIDPSVIFSLIQDNPHLYQLSGPNAFKITDDLADPFTRMNKIETLFDTLYETLH